MKKKEKCPDSYTIVYQNSITIHVLGKGTHKADADLPETFLWQIEGKSAIQVNGKDYELLQNQTMLIQAGDRYSIENGFGGRTLSVVMNPV
ncbi:3-hydroxyanthranilate 3,4-dioxygenase [Caerostris darwini]|uniref:3-hydroxyanthranilate 3,4-dioxygenase n=1 Tax=Caerostris darwini TaxID=1538125 RepID=A0AAV4SI49_9ARAC|nr:3-hydroxyanthranilate 3,4-dioxygenase [Caerostris darwini]